ncbi:MAG: hypothetical protein U0869_07500 [Chloroflexota bacterium]
MTKLTDPRATAAWTAAGAVAQRRQPRIPSIRPRSLGAIRLLQAELERRPAARRPRWWSLLRLGADPR